MTTEANCIFCKIARGEAPAVKVFEDDQTVAFMDIFPVTKGHALVISKAHHRDLRDIAPAALNAVTATTQRLARAIYRALQPDGMRMVQFNGEAAGQTVFHYHVHLRPAYSGQNNRASHGQDMADQAELEQLAKLIGDALE